MLTTLFVVFALAQGPAAQIASGQCYADLLQVPYPVPGTPYWQEPIPLANGTHAAMAIDSVIETCLGQTYQTSEGEFTFPDAEEAQDLECEDFAQLCDWRDGCASVWYECNQ